MPFSTVKSGRSGERGARRNPGPGDDEVGLERAFVQGEPHPVPTFDLATQVEDHAMLFMQTPHPTAQFVAEDAAERDRFRRRQMHLDPAMPQRGRDLERDEARARHCHPLGAFGRADDSVGVG